MPIRPMDDEEDVSAPKPSLMDQMFGSVRPEDENTYPSSPRNLAVEHLGLPENWRMSRADEKIHNQELPQMMGSGTVGSVGKVSPALLEAAAMKAYPEFAQHIPQMAKNLKAPLVFEGAMPASFQKLRDFMSHTGPLIKK